MSRKERPVESAGRRAPLRAMLVEPVRYRELLYSLVRRDLLLRYKQTLLGFGWAVMVPLLHMLVFTVIFTRVVPLETDLPYPIYAYAGLLPWSFFASALTFGATSLTQNVNLVTKVWFPREIFPFSAVLVAFVDFAVASLLLGGLMVWYGIAPGWQAVLIPAVILVQMVFTAGMALLLALAHLLYRDVKYLLGVGLTVWMLLTAVVYPVERIGGRLGAWLTLNPMTPIVDAYRDLLLRGELPPALPLAYAALVAIVTLLGSWRLFHRLEPRFAELI